MSTNNEKLQEILDEYTPSAAGRTRAGQGRILSSHIPVRFPPVTAANLRELATREGVTVSSWIRTLVEREIEWRVPQPRSGLASWSAESRWPDHLADNAAVSSNGHLDVIPAL